MWTEKLLTARGVYGLFPCKCNWDDDVELYCTGDTRSYEERSTSCTFCGSRRTAKATNPAARSSDFIAPKETGLQDSIGAFAVTTGHRSARDSSDSFKAQHDDYSAIMAEALADRLAEAFAEYLHKQVREDSGATAAQRHLTTANRSFSEKYRGIRPAPGYPACPDHTEKATIWRLLDVQAEHRHRDHRIVRDVAPAQASAAFTSRIRNRASSAWERSSETR